MSQIVDFSTENAQVTDEVINVANSNPVNLYHDIFYNKTGKLVVISTGAGGGGTVLTNVTDYTIGGAVSDSFFPVSISPDVGYTTVAITNATYHNTNLYVSYYPISDVFKAARWNNDTALVGELKAYAGSTAPSGWLECDGSAISRAVYKRLFDVIGTAYGAGDGSTTFNLPNAQGVGLVGAGSQTIGGVTYGGSAVGDFEADQMQGHWHESYTYAGAATSVVLAGSSGSTQNLLTRQQIQDPISDGANGTPRTGTYTRGPAIAVKYIIKY